MNIKFFARFVLVFAAGFFAVSGAEASGSLSIGVTIVSSCAVSGSAVYRAAASNAASHAGLAKTLVGACGSDSSYSVTLSPAVKAESVAMTAYERQVSAQSDTGDVIMTLTY